MPSRRIEPQEIIAEVQQLGAEIEQRLSRVFELSETLYNSVRRGPFRQEKERLTADLQLIQTRLSRGHEPPERVQQLDKLDAHEEIVPIYVMYANAWKRLAGSMHQGLRRTASVERLVSQIQRKHGVDEQATARPEPAAAPAQGTGSVEELIELYGEETVNGS
jgi:hypothetical protein